MGDKKEELLKLVKNTLRSVLIPNKEGIPARAIAKVYDELACSPLPYRQLGYSSCEEFIRSIPDVVRIGRNRDGTPQLFAVATEATAHIVKMVSAQRNKKVRRNRPGKAPVRRPYNQKPGPPPRSYQSRYGYPSRPAYQSSAYARPPPRPIGKPFSKPSRPFPRQSYNTTSGPPSRPPPSQQLPYRSQNAPSGPPYKDFAITVQNNRRGNGVELSYDNEEFEQESANRGKLKSVVVRPALLSQSKARPQSPGTEGIKFGENFDIPPRFRSSRNRGEKENYLPAGYPEFYNIQSRQAYPCPQPQQVYTQRAPFVERGQLYKKLVLDYCKWKNFPTPKYDTMPMRKGHVSSLTLDGRSYGSLEPYQDVDSAEEAAAMNACKALHIEKGLQNSVEIQPKFDDQPLNFDPKVKDRIAQILKSKPNGIWLTRLPVEYKEKHHEDFPGNLLRLLQSWTDLVRLDRNEHANTYIVYHAAPKADIPKSALFPIQQRVAVYMTYLSEDGQFYVQQADTDIDNINEDIQSLTESAGRIPGPELSPGVFCVAKYATDNTWCRARVLQYVPGTNLVDVLFVDYGNEEQIALQSIRKLNSKLAVHPAQAVKCELYGVKPWQGEMWSEQSIDKFAEVCGNVELLALTISHTGNMCVVELYSSPESLRSVNELMVREGLLKPTAEEYLAFRPSTPDVKPDSTAANGVHPLESEDQKSDEAVTGAASPGEPGPIIFPDERYWNVYVSFLTSINDITFRLVGENYSDRLEELEMILEECFTSAGDADTLITEGAVCVASADSLFHRVRILDLDDNMARCYFLDHGDTAEMDVKNLRLISPDYNKLPYQACHCELAGVEVTDDSLRALALESLLNFVLGKTCVAEVVTSYGRFHSVILYDTSGEEDVNINEAIGKLTAAENSKNVQFVKPSEFLLLGPYDLQSPWDDKMSVTSESSTTSSVGKSDSVTVVTIKPKFLKYQTSRESNFNDTESVSSESSSTSEMSVTMKPKFLSKSKTTIANQTAVSDANLNTFDDLQLSSDSASLSELQPPSIDPSTSQLDSIDTALLDQFSRGINLESIVGTTLAPVLSQDKVSSLSSSTEDRFSLRPEDIPLPESCSELSSISDVDIGLLSETGMPPIALSKGIKPTVGKSEAWRPSDDWGPPPAAATTTTTGTEIWMKPATTGTGDWMKTASTADNTGTGDWMKTASTADNTGTGDWMKTASIADNTGTGDWMKTASIADNTGTGDSMKPAPTAATTDIGDWMNPAPTAATTDIGDSMKPVAAASTTDPGSAVVDVGAQGDGAHLTNVDIWSKEYMNLPLPPYFSPPPVGDYIDVHVRFVNDPDNFVCLPYNSLEEFARFTETLNTYMNDNPPKSMLTLEEVYQGQVYAGLWYDTWYRVVINHKDADLACILLADIGEFDVLSLSDLRPLPLRFWKFPFLAFKARLHGATLGDSKQWTEASKFKFTELVKDKNLVGLVRGKDEQTGVVSLELVDTSSDDQDVHINEVFNSKLISWLDS